MAEKSLSNGHNWFRRFPQVFEGRLYGKVFLELSFGDWNWRFRMSQFERFYVKIEFEERIQILKLRMVVISSLVDEMVEGSCDRSFSL